MLKIFTYFVLLTTVPAFLIYPNNILYGVTFQEINYEYQHKTQEWVRPTTYDEIIQLLEDLESGELERKCSTIQLEKVNAYLVTLAKEGFLPDEFEEEMEIEEDAYDLVYGEDSVFQLAHFFKTNNEYMIIPAIFNRYSGYDVIQCGKISKTWKKTKKFVKKHKKAIIIGAVVVVATTVIVITVVATSSVAAATAAVGASGAAASSGSSGSNSLDSNYSESGKSESKNEPLAVSDTPKETHSPITDVNEVPIMKVTIDEHISSFKEFLVEDKAVQEATSFKGWDDLSFGEKARELGAGLTHKAFDEITDLVKVVPQLCEEVKEIGAKILPESLTSSSDIDIGSSIENYDNLAAKGHQAIDKVFSTDQSECFTAEAKANDPMNNFAIGFLPPPGAVFKTLSDTSKFARAGKVIDRGGFTKAGRNLMKHGYREGSVFPKPIGNSAQVNKHGQQVLERILNHPEKKVVQYMNKIYGPVIEVEAPKLGGIRFNSDGTEMMGFLEPKWFKQ